MAQHQGGRVGGEEQEAATRNLASDLYKRARASDKPEVTQPSPSQRWTVVEAPRVAQAYHASAVLIDALRQFDGSPTKEDDQMQALAHQRSQQLSAQLSRALATPPCVPARALHSNFDTEETVESRDIDGCHGAHFLFG